MTSHAYSRMLAEDREVISYRPRLNQLTGGVLATILLQQIVFRWHNQGSKRFYKFFAPCSHEDYRPGDSWQEELGFSRSELTTAMSRIACKIEKGTSRKEMFPKCLVVYWTDRTRKTWFEVNEELLDRWLGLIYLSNVDFLHYIENVKRPHYPLAQESNITSPNTETTSKTTTEISNQGKGKESKSTGSWRDKLGEYEAEILPMYNSDELLAECDRLNMHPDDLKAARSG